MEEMTDKYEVIFREGQEENALIRVLKGKFANFVYEYGQVSVNERTDGDLKVSFTYELKEAPQSFEPKDEPAEKKEFEEMAGNILYDIVVNTDQVKERVKKTNGIDNTSQPDEG